MAINANIAPATYPVGIDKSEMADTSDAVSDPSAVESDAPKRRRLLLVELQKNLMAWVFFLAVLGVSRLVYLYALRLYWPVKYSWLDLVMVFLGGTRFDVVVASALTLLQVALAPLVLVGGRGAAASTWARCLAVGCFVFSAPILMFGSIGYWREFNEPINAFAFELFEDDTWGILRTMQSQHGLLQKLGYSAVLSVLLWLLYRRKFERTLLSEQRAAQLASRTSYGLASTGVLVAFLLVGARGSIVAKPLDVDDSLVTHERFFNKATLNGFFALHAARLQRVEHLNNPAAQWSLDPRQLTEAAHLLIDSSSAPDSADAPKAGHEPGAVEITPERSICREAPGTANPPPDHIFVVIMESYDAWPLEDKYASMNLVPEGRKLAHDGLHVRGALPATGSSFSSFLGISSGLHDTDGRHQAPFPTAMAPIFNSLGYTTRLFIGDPSNWHDSQDVADRQGFQQYYGANEIATHFQTGQSRAHDREVFDFVRMQLRDEKRSLNVIRTISNHGPYEVDLDREECNVEPVHPAVESRLSELLRVLYGHLKYSDKCLGTFVRQVLARHPNSLFVITGDHAGHSFPNTHPTEFERICVPIILYGPQVLAGLQLPKGVVACHMDITPTIVDLAAPRGFAFSSLGSDLLIPRREYWAVSLSHVLGNDHLVRMEGELVIHRLPWTDESAPESPAALNNPGRFVSQFAAAH